MGRRRFATGLVLPVSLLALLAGLAWLQYRWTGEISRAEAERMRASLRSSVHRFARDVDEEALRILRTFRFGGEEELERALARYREDAPFPELVEEVRFDPSGLFEPDRGRPHARPRRSRFDWRRERFPVPRFSDDPLSVTIPVRGEPPGDVVVTLDRNAVFNSLLPRLSERHFGSGDALDYDVVIVDREGSSIYATTDSVRERVLADPDARAELFSPRAILARQRPRRGPRPERRPMPPPRDANGGLPRRSLGDGGHWTIYVQHREGSLESAVARVRFRNVAVSFGIMALLGGSIVLLTASARRATELSNRKMEFVAGVSHELRTPVAVVRSAGQNLADGSVSDPAQVRRYGSLIEAETTRLSELVDQVLELAGIQSQKRRYHKTRLSTRALAESVAADALAHADGGNMNVTVEPGGEEGFVLGDEEALRRAIANLVGNAIKHGGEDNEVRLGIETNDGGVGIYVADRGPGIRSDDREHLFEAFYRGRRTVERQVPGSGLGLSLVEHIVREHGGRVDVDSAPGRGSRFTLWLPAAPVT